MTDPGWADRARQLLETTACWFVSQLDAAMPILSRTVYRILARNGLHSRIAAQKPALNKKTAKKPCCVLQGPQPDGRMDSRKCDCSDESSVELHPKRRQYYL